MRSICQPRKERLAASVWRQWRRREANYNFAWRRGEDATVFVRGCVVTDERAISNETRQCGSAVERRRRKKEGRTDGRHNFHLGKLPATIKMMRADSAELEGPSEREEKGEGQEHSSPFQL